MKPSQKEYGEEMLGRLSEKFEVSQMTMAKILLDTKEHKNFWSWVNASDFLETYIEENN